MPWPSSLSIGTGTWPRRADLATMARWWAELGTRMTNLCVSEGRTHVHDAEQQLPRGGCGGI